MMQTGNIFLVHNPWYWKRPLDSFFYWLLRLVIGHWHHCAMYWECPDGRFIVQAIGKGVSVSTYDNWLQAWPNRVTRLIPVTCPASRFTRYAGVKYDRKSLFCYLLIKKWTGRWLGANVQQADQALYCFELAGYAYQIPNANQILPEEFITYFQQHPYV